MELWIDFINEENDRQIIKVIGVKALYIEALDSYVIRADDGNHEHSIAFYRKKEMEDMFDNIKNYIYTGNILRLNVDNFKLLHELEEEAKKDGKVFMWGKGD